MCKYCDINQEAHDYEIELYRCNSYEYEGDKYFLMVQHPAGTYKKLEWAKPLEINFCPVCGRKLTEANNDV